MIYFVIGNIILNVIMLFILIRYIRPFKYSAMWISRFILSGLKFYRSNCSICTKGKSFFDEMKKNKTPYKTLH